MSLNKKQKTLFGIIGAVLAVALIAVIVMLAVSSCADEKIYTPKDIITVTIDEPGVVLTLNNQKNVVDVKSVGESDIDPEYLKNIHFQTALERILSEMSAEGTFKGTADDAMLIMVESLNEEDYDTIGDSVNGVWTRHGYTAKILPLYIKARQASIEKTAEQKDITYAKAYFCQKIAKESGNLKADELYGKSIAEIYKLSKEDKSDDHINSVINSLNSSQVEIEPPVSSSEVSSGDGENSSHNTSTGSSSVSSSSDSGSSAAQGSSSSASESSDSSSQGGTFETSMSQADNGGWTDGWY